MKHLHLLLLAAIALMSAGVPVVATYTLSSDYKVTIHGTSNIHNWEETVTTVTGASAVNWNTDGTFNLNGVNLKMDVRSIKSDMGSAMNNNTYKALKADANPKILFVLTAPINSIPIGATAKVINASGNLTIAGVTNQVTMQVKVSMPQQGRLEFEGEQAVKMTDYGVTPPTALFGTMKTGNDIKISFKTSFALAVN